MEICVESQTQQQGEEVFASTGAGTGTGQGTGQGTGPGTGTAVQLLGGFKRTRSEGQCRWGNLPGERAECSWLCVRMPMQLLFS